MDAVTLHCPACGAAAEAEATACRFCRARLATVACPSCFGLAFVGSRHCAHCGARLARPAAAPAALPCPRECGPLERRELGGVTLHECTGCGGVWVDEPTFERLCAERARLAPALPTGGRRGTVAPDRVRYGRCPQCARMMNRVNFARTSGVIVDRCRSHGVWFDEDELRRVVEFVRSGGMDRARALERAQLAEERRLLEMRQRLMPPSPVPSHPKAQGEPTAASLVAALVKLLTD